MASSFTDLLAFLNMDIETAVTLLVLISLGIGLLTNLPSISFLSKKNSKRNENSVNRAIKSFSYLTMSSILDDNKHSEDHSHKKKFHPKKTLDYGNPSIHRKRIDIHKEVGEATQRTPVSHPRSNIRFLPRALFILFGPMLLVSAIPSFYPIYKSYLSPYLPEVIQRFFTDVKNLFLSLFNAFTTGAILDESYQSTNLTDTNGNRLSFPFSLQDWIYSYISRCDLSYQYSLISYCLTCTSPSILNKWITYHSLDICTPCDKCIIEMQQMSKSVSQIDHSCENLLQDLSRIMDRSDGYTGKSFAAVMIDSFNTFILYNRFFIHLFSRICIHFILDIYFIILQVVKYFTWLFLEMIHTFSVNKSRSIALLFLLVLLLAITVATVRILFKCIRSILRFFYSSLFPESQVELTATSPEEKQETSITSAYLSPSDQEESSLLADRIHIARRMSNQPNLKPDWITPEIEAAIQSNGMSVKEHWLVIVKENPAIAELIVDCTHTSEEFDWLVKLLEQLYTEKEIPFDLIESIRAVLSTRPTLSPSPFNRYSGRPTPTPSIPFSPVLEAQSPSVFSPSQNTEGRRLSRATSTSGLGRVVRPPFFRMQNTLKGKPYPARNSAGSDMANWNVMKSESSELL